MSSAFDGWVNVMHFPSALTYGEEIALGHTHEDDDHSDDHYRVNGIWRFPITGVSLRIKDITIE